MLILNHFLRKYCIVTLFVIKMQQPQNIKILSKILKVLIRQFTKTGAVVQKNVLAELKYASRLIVSSSFRRTAFTLSWNDNSHAYNFNTCK